MSVGLGVCCCVRVCWLSVAVRRCGPTNSGIVVQVTDPAGHTQTATVGNVASKGRYSYLSFKVPCGVNLTVTATAPSGCTLTTTATVANAGSSGVVTLDLRDLIYCTAFDECGNALAGATFTAAGYTATSDSTGAATITSTGAPFGASVPVTGSFQGVSQTASGSGCGSMAMIWIRNLCFTVDGCSGLPLSGATATVSGGSSGSATSDAQGKVCVPLSPAAAPTTALTVTFSKTRFQPLTITINLGQPGPGAYGGGTGCDAVPISYQGCDYPCRTVTLLPASGYQCVGCCADPVSETLQGSDPVGGCTLTFQANSPSPLGFGNYPLWVGCVSRQSASVSPDPTNCGANAAPGEVPVYFVFDPSLCVMSIYGPCCQISGTNVATNAGGDDCGGLPQPRLVALLSTGIQSCSPFLGSATTHYPSNQQDCTTLIYGTGDLTAGVSE